MANSEGRVVHIEVIETLPAFTKLEENWNAVYDADPDARVFLSWKWLMGWLSHLSGPWFVLAAKESEAADAPYVAFFPLRLQTKVVDGHIRNEVNMAGNFAADYTGIVCSPELEHRAVPALARYLKQMRWAAINLENLLMSENRLRLFLAHFPKSGFQTRLLDRTGKVDKINNCICPYVTLPADWDSYLAGLSTNTRHNIRRVMRHAEGEGEFRITHATPETYERDLDGLLALWETKWKSRKGDAIGGLVRSNKIMLSRSFQSGLLFIPTFWHGERMVGALATMIDPRKRAFMVYMTGRDETFEGPSPGIIMHAYSIRHAIASGFSEYDFMRGNETYKYPFGVTERHIKCMVLSTKNGLNLGGKIDRRTIPDVLERATELHQAGKLAEAERGYRQILEVESENADAIHRLGQLFAAKGEHRRAKSLFDMLTTIRPDNVKSWLCLAQSCEALGQYSEAVEAYCKVMKLNPAMPEVFKSLATMLIKLGGMEEVNAMLLAAAERAADGAGPNGGKLPTRLGNGHAPEGALPH